MAEKNIVKDQEQKQKGKKENIKKPNQYQKSCQKEDRWDNCCG